MRTKYGHSGYSATIAGVQRRRYGAAPVAAPSAFLTAVALALILPTTAVAQLSQPFWSGYGRDAQHTALSTVASQPLTRIRWQTPVDLHPQYSGNDLLIHYGSPLITQANTVIVPGQDGRHRRLPRRGRRGSDGRLLWRQLHRLPAAAARLDAELFADADADRQALASRPAAARCCIARGSTRAAAAPTRSRLLRHAGVPHAPPAYLNDVFINTPITADAAGNVFFGFQVTGDHAGRPAERHRPHHRRRRRHLGRRPRRRRPIASITKVVHNCAPALSNDGSTLYVAVSNGDGFGGPRAIWWRSTAARSPPSPRCGSRIPSAATTPTCPTTARRRPPSGPDGDVYFGVLENPFPSNNDRGWLLHFDAMLTPEERAGRLRLGRHGVDRAGVDGPVVCRHVVVSADDQVQQLRRHRQRRRRQSARRSSIRTIR